MDYHHVLNGEGERVVRANACFHLDVIIIFCSRIANIIFPMDSSYDTKELAVRVMKKSCSSSNS